MNAARQTAKGDVRRHGWSGFVAQLVGGRFSTLLSFFVLLVLFIGGFSFAWRRWGEVVTNHPRFVLDEEHLEITEPPRWIKGNVKHEVMRDGSLGELKILDPQTTIRVAHAFALHTWVADVKRVRKEPPGRVVVELEYRRPIAMVEVVTNGRKGLLPVDGKGVLLPPQDFSEEETRDYVRIAVGETLPLGPVGTPWGDDRVAGAALIATQLGAYWKTLDVARITARPNEAGGRRKPNEIIYELFTRQGSRVTWGHAPGMERPTEAKGGEKVDRLVRYFQERPPRAGESLDIDVQGKSGLTIAPLSSLAPVSHSP